MIGSADDRRLGDQAQGGEPRARLLDPGRSRRALAENEGEGLLQADKTLDRRQAPAQISRCRSARDKAQVCRPHSGHGRGVKPHLLDLGGDISGNGLSKLFLTIAAAFAEAERDRKRSAPPR
jgi:hypothetical protein